MAPALILGGGTVLTPGSGVASRNRKPASGLWTPASLPNLVVGADFSDTSTITQSSNAVSSVAGSWGTSVAMTATGTTQPLTNTDTMNGKNVLKFDGVDDALNFTWNVSQPLTFFLVVKAADTNSHCIIDAGSGVTFLFIQKFFSYNYFMHAGSTNFGNGPTLDTNAHAIVMVVNGTSSILRVDGTEYTGGDTGGNGAGPWKLGGSSGSGFPWWLGDIGAFAGCTGAASSSDRAAWCNWSHAQFGTP